MKKIIIIFILTLIYGYCKSQKLNIGGTYVSNLIENEIPSNQKYRVPDDIYDKIISYNIKFKLSNKWGDNKKIYDDGITTAINNSKITKFYIAYCLSNKKNYDNSIFVPKLDSVPYNRINDIIKSCNLEVSNHRLIRYMCFNLMDCLLYEDYFGINFLYGDVHQIASNIEINHQTLFYDFTNVEGDIRKILEYREVITMIRIIEKYINYQ